MSCTNSCRPPTNGTRIAHCSVCHRTFSAVFTFDQHRVRGACVITSLTEKNGIWGNWGTNAWRGGRP